MFIDMQYVNTFLVRYFDTPLHNSIKDDITYPMKATTNINAPVMINIIGGACIFPSRK